MEYSNAEDKAYINGKYQRKKADKKKYDREKRIKSPPIKRQAKIAYNRIMSLADALEMLKEEDDANE